MNGGTLQDLPVAQSISKAVIKALLADSSWKKKVLSTARGKKRLSMIFTDNFRKKNFLFWVVTNSQTIK